MSEKQFGIGLKISIAVACIILILEVALMIIVLNTKENTISILEGMNGIENITETEETTIVEEDEAGTDSTDEAIDNETTQEAVEDSENVVEENTIVNETVEGNVVE